LHEYSLKRWFSSEIRSKLMTERALTLFIVLDAYDSIALRAQLLMSQIRSGIEYIV